MRYLRPAALLAASLVLLLATDGTGVSAGAAARTTAVPRIRAVTLPDRGAPPRYRETWSGAAFDACAAPPLDTLRAWRGTSPYGAVGIYTSGSQRGCGQPRLTADWVRQARALGWRFLPVHVGLQAPCADQSSKPRRIDPANAVQQGRDEAGEAVRALQPLGFGVGSPVYLDIEAYPLRDPACSQAVVDFTLGWTQALHSAGYRSGFYSSLDSGITDLAAAARAGSSPMPDALWYARWDDHADTAGSGALTPDLWGLHQRVHQYHGNVEETYGGAALTIDRNQVDGPTAG
ncbi:glycoside hydrolase domain-containing protein [Streptomyces sp. NRRL S-350]|uniref:glycoside hydrolase domain-containing protein n=1 Tax=Streptomyces sp. NRRL S-350 TaxID=1463902 RepID=UPI0004C22CA0|nr:glycoside hydrolase domain-containing protein [Streptomyces sp. NRRL S-350]